MKFNSKYSPNKEVSAAQYITELICEKRAISLKTKLPLYFWRLPDWQKYYKYQIRLANKLLTEYPASVVIKAISDYRNKATFSLKSPRLLKIIQEYSVKEKNTNYVQADIELVESTSSVGRQHKKNTGIWDDLNG